MIIQIIRIHSALDAEVLLERAKERAKEFEQLEGLIQKYYVKLGTQGGYGGIYIWENRDAMENFRDSELAAGIPDAYEILEAPDVELAEVLFQLR
ncbi:hypothetical protein [Persicobacter diffluens]|uniref:Monooxygenase n=1 Tax=Persicobacter diffluens TaxID=981 RepID=A0AAN5AJ49_9BACT|nr:hypothetical protein PEDI_11160 [Persicobacter diffluens]